MVQPSDRVVNFAQGGHSHYSATVSAETFDKSFAGGYTFAPRTLVKLEKNRNERTECAPLGLEVRYWRVEMHANDCDERNFRDHEEHLKASDASREIKKAADDAPIISVVIPSYNSARYIRRCLRALLAQKTELPFEIILVDSSDDGADRIVAAEFPHVRLFHFDERRTVGTARNIGIEQAQGDIILFLDTDCIANSAWINQMYRGIQALNADGVGGSLKNGTPWSISGCIAFYLEFFRVLPCKAKPYESSFLIGGNCGFRRTVFEIARYTDRSVADDWIFNWQMITQGKKLFFLPLASVEHINKTGLSQVLRYQYKLGLGACVYRSRVSPDTVRVFKRFPILVFLMPAAIVPRIGALVLKRRGISEFLKFVVLLPMLWVANTAWAAGFYRELMNQKSGKAATF